MLNTIIGFGASSMQGAGDSQGGWFARAETLSADKRLRWINRGVGGNTTRDMLPIRIYGPLEFVVAGGKRVRRPLPEMRFGAPVDILADVTTEHLGALLLYDSAVCERIPPHHTAMIRMLGQPGPWGVPRPLDE